MKTALDASVFGPGYSTVRNAGKQAIFTSAMLGKHIDWPLVDVEQDMVDRNLADYRNRKEE